MKKSLFKVVTLSCVAVLALWGGSVLVGCSEDDETDVEEIDFSEFQFNTLAERRMTRSAEGHYDWCGPTAPPDSVVIYEAASGEFGVFQSEFDVALHASCNGGMGYQVKGKLTCEVISAASGFHIVGLDYTDYFNGVAMIIEYTLKYSFNGHNTDFGPINPMNPTRPYKSCAGTVYFYVPYHFEPAAYGR